MSQLSFVRPAFESFWIDFKSGHSIKSKIIYSLTTAICFSAFIYLDNLGITNKFIYSLLAIISIILFLNMPQKITFFFGFFIGILWFWGVSLSFIYYGLSFMIPFVIVGFGLCYGAFFYFAGLYDNPFYKGFFLFAISYFEPFGFNWFKPELIFINSNFAIDKLSFSILLLVLALFLQFRKIWILGFLLLSLSFGMTTKYNSHLKIYIPVYSIEQEVRWDANYIYAIIDENMKNIDLAIKNKYDLIILPETAFSVILNKENYLLQSLIAKGQKTAIIAGGLYTDGTNLYNSTYFFRDGTYSVAHKTVLVPFGEAVPLPALLRDIINGAFFGGAQDYETAKRPTDFSIKREKFRNAICYEATKDELFVGNPKQMIAISNMAWFSPSSFVSLQNLLLKYYSKKYNTIIYHSVNMGQNAIYKP